MCKMYVKIFLNSRERDTLVIIKDFKHIEMKENAKQPYMCLYVLLNKWYELYCMEQVIF